MAKEATTSRKVTDNPIKELVGTVADVSNTASGDFTTIAVSSFGIKGLKVIDIVVSNDIKEKMFGRVATGKHVQVKYRENKAGDLYLNKAGDETPVKADGIFAEAITPVDAFTFQMLMEEVKELRAEARQAE